MFLVVELDVHTLLIAFIDGSLPVEQQLFKEFVLEEGVESEFEFGFGFEEVAAPLVLALEFGLLSGIRKFFLRVEIGFEKN